MPAIALSTKDFPRIDETIRGSWAPVYIEPIIGSGERLVIGVVAVSDKDTLVVEASGLKRLSAFYGSGGAPIEIAARSSLAALQSDLARRGRAAIDRPELPFATVTIGELRQGAADTLSHIALNWLKMISSLEDESSRDRGQSASLVLKKSRLQALRNVADIVEQRRPGMRGFFSPRILGLQKGTPKFEVRPDFLGSRITASIGMVDPRHGRDSVENLKARLFDLESDFESASPPLLKEQKRRFELLVLSRKESDEKRQTRDSIVDEIVEGATKVAELKNIKVRSYDTPESIASHLVAEELAA
jgi:hypothetical protein